MKKLLFLFALILLSVTFIISCDDANANLEVPPSGNAEKEEIVILDFLDSEAASSRGLVAFPTEGNPFFSVEDGEKENLLNGIPGTNYGFWMSCNVMRSLPVFPGLKSVNASADAFVASIKNKDLNGYGFTLRVVEAKKTDDGVYIIYDVLEDERVNGRVEYYYSTVEKKFSYREIVAPLLSLQGGDQVFVFEMFNVPVEKTQDGYSFKAGELYNNGSEFRHISFISDTIARNMQGLDINLIDKFNVEESQLVMNYDGNKVTSMEYKKYVSNAPIGGEEGSFQYDPKNIPLSELTGGVITEYNVKNRAEVLKLDGQLEFLKTIFNNKSFTFEGYNSLSDFNNSRLEYLDGKQELLKEYTTHEDFEFNGIGFPLSYDLDENIGACLYCNNGTVHESNFSSENGGYSFTPFVLEKFKKCFGVENEIESFDNFVQLMFSNLGLSQYADSETERKTLLSDSYKLF